MSAYKKIFPKKHTFLAVVHAVGWEQAVRNTRVALDNGADGVFLINHGVEAFDLYQWYGAVRLQHSKAWLGINYLGLDHNIDALNMLPPHLSGLWFDGAGEQESETPQNMLLHEFYRERGKQAWDGLVFWGVAFKGQNQPENPRTAALIASTYVDVVTTSGDFTGKPPTVEKIRAMREGTDFPLAIASGIHRYNVSEYLPHADCFLVATGISRSFVELDPLKVQAFARQLE